MSDVMSHVTYQDKRQTKRKYCSMCVLQCRGSTVQCVCCSVCVAVCVCCSVPNKEEVLFNVCVAVCVLQCVCVAVCQKKRKYCSMCVLQCVAVCQKKRKYCWVNGARELLLSHVLPPLCVAVVFPSPVM